MFLTSLLPSEGFYLSGFPSSPLTLNFFKLVSLNLTTLSATQIRLLLGLMSISEGKLETLGKLKNFIWARIASVFGECQH